MSETYRRPTIGQWLRPVTIGPFVAAWTAALVYARFGVRDELFWGALVLGVVLGSLWAFGYALVAALLDVALLGVKLRRLPHGRGAWLQAFVAPAVSLGSYVLVPPHRWWRFGPWAVVAAILAPPAIALVASRVLVGKKP